MDKIKAGVVWIWSLACEGYHHVVDAIERHPSTTFWLVLTYMVIRR